MAPSPKSCQRDLWTVRNWAHLSPINTFPWLPTALKEKTSPGLWECEWPDFWPLHQPCFVQLSNIVTASQSTGVPWMHQSVSYLRAFTPALLTLEHFSIYSVPQQLLHSYSSSHLSFSELPPPPNNTSLTSQNLSQSAIIYLFVWLFVDYFSLLHVPAQTGISMKALVTTPVQLTYPQHSAQCLARRKTSEDNGNWPVHQILLQRGWAGSKLRLREIISHLARWFSANSLKARRHFFRWEKELA